MLGHLFLVCSYYASRAGTVLEFMLWFLYLFWGCVFLRCCVVESSPPWASPYAEGGFLYAWAVCSELLLKSDDAYFKFKPETLNPKLNLATLNLVGMTYWNLRYREL